MLLQMITLTTDFGHKDAFVGTMKGVILSICPNAQIVDICHEVPPQDVLSAALLLADSCHYFPVGTIHVAVVDPGVGSPRMAIAIQTPRYVFIGPDNGLFTPALQNEKVVAAVQLNNTAFHRKPVSDTFQGRDIFAPAAAHLAAGVELRKLGDPINSWTTLTVPQPRLKGDVLEAQVLRIDRFGNAISSLRAADYQAWNPTGRRLVIKSGHATIQGICRKYSDVPEKEPVAYFGSGGRLEIAVNGRADERLGLKPNVLILLVLQA
jgi:hypothetical protein